MRCRNILNKIDINRKIYIGTKAAYVSIQYPYGVNSSECGSHFRVALAKGSTQESGHNSVIPRPALYLRLPQNAVGI